jgi:hypothetical protein
MAVDKNVLGKFFFETDHSGRFMVVSQRTGVKYFVEPIAPKNSGAKFGDIDPATKKLTGSYGDKYRGAVEEHESLITAENGFKNIRLLDKGVSPLLAIDSIDAKYKNVVKK